MTTIALKKEKSLRNGAIPWTSCKPFVENTKAVLIHRPRHVTTHKIGDRWPAHLGVHCWCGNCMMPPQPGAFSRPKRATCITQR